MFIVPVAEVAVYLSHGYYLSNEETPGDGIQWGLLTNKSRLMIWTPVGIILSRLSVVPFLPLVVG